MKGEVKNERERERERERDRENLWFSRFSYSSSLLRYLDIEGGISVEEEEDITKSVG